MFFLRTQHSDPVARTPTQISEVGEPRVQHTNLERPRCLPLPGDTSYTPRKKELFYDGIL